MTTPTLTAATARPGPTLVPARRSVLSAGMLIAAATALAAGANYASNISLARVLPERQFASAALLVSGLLILTALSTGFQLATARATAEQHSDTVALLRVRGRRAGLALGFLLALGSPAWSAMFHVDDWLPFVLLGIALPIHVRMSVDRGVLQGRGVFGPLALSLAIEAVVRLVVTLAALTAGLGVLSAAAGLGASFLVGGLVIRRPTRLSSRTVDSPPPLTTAQRAGSRTGSDRIGAAVALLLVGQVVVANGDILVVSAFAPSIAGLYAAVALVGRVVFVAGWSVVTVVFPSLVSDGADGADGEWMIRRTSYATALVGGVLTLAAAVFGNQVISSMLSVADAPGAALLWPYALATTLFTLVNVRAAADVAGGRRRAPLALAIGAVVQTLAVAAAASSGASAAIWSQVVVMASLLAIVSTRPAPRDAMH